MVRRNEEDPSVFVTELEILVARDFGDASPSARTWMVRDRFVSGHRDCALRRRLDSVPLDTPIRDIVDRCRVWESYSDIYVGYRRLPIVTDNSRRLSTITVSFPGIAGPPRIEPVVPVVMVRTALPEEPTVLEVLAQKILDQTVNCGEKSSTVSGPPLTNFRGTPKCPD